MGIARYKILIWKESCKKAKPQLWDAVKARREEITMKLRAHTIADPIPEKTSLGGDTPRVAPENQPALSGAAPGRRGPLPLGGVPPESPGFATATTPPPQAAIGLIFANLGVVMRFVSLYGAVS